MAGMVALRDDVPLARMTVDDFLAWARNNVSGRGWQLIDGIPVAMAPAAVPHAAIMGALSSAIGGHLERTRPECQLLIQPGVVPRAQSKTNYRVPDLGVTCAPPSRDLFARDCVLLIEVPSPSNEADTRANVWAYTTLPSVLEILLIQSTRIEAELLQREPDGAWPEVPKLLKPDDMLTLASIGFEVPLRAAYRTTFLAAG